MKTNADAGAASQSLIGGIYAATAFVIWGLSPIYWKALHTVPALEIILHRVLWSFVFLMPLVWFGRHRPMFMRMFKQPKLMAILLFTSILVAGNWLLYIWAVTHGRVLQASLGYYINPLVNVLLGMVFLRERLRKAQVAAVLLAVVSVVNLTAQYGIFPWVSLTLAFSFGAYGLIRKVVAVGSLDGLAMEILWLAGPALIWVMHMHADHTGLFLRSGTHIDWLLAGTGVITSVPLLLFNLGAKRITLSSLGFIQYIAPTCMLVLGITIFGEPFTKSQIITFGLIWSALAIYSTDMVMAHRRHSEQ